MRSFFLLLLGMAWVAVGQPERPRLVPSWTGISHQLIAAALALADFAVVVVAEFVVVGINNDGEVRVLGLR